MSEPHVCIDCRTLVRDGEPCDGGRYHRVVSLATGEGRERLRAHVWGPPELRKQVLEASKAGGLGAFLDGLACTSCGDVAALGEGIGVAIAGVIGVFLLVASAFWLIASAVRWVQRRRGRLRPTGVAHGEPKRGERRTGRIVRGTPTPPPIGDEVGVAWGLALEGSDAAGAGSYLLVAGETNGFVVERDDGAVLEVPAGRVRIARGDGWSRLPSNLVRAYAASLDERDDGELHPPLPADRGSRLVLNIGERVTVIAPTTLTAGDGRPAGYRDAQAARRTTGVPWLALDG